MEPAEGEEAMAAAVRRLCDGRSCMGGGLLTVPDVGQSAPAEATVSGVEPSRSFTPYTGKSGTGVGLGGTQRKSPYGYSP